MDYINSLQAVEYKLYTAVLRQGDPWPLEQSFHGT